MSGLDTTSSSEVSPTDAIITDAIITDAIPTDAASALPEQIVTPWVASSSQGFDYQRLIDQFGLDAIDEALITEFESVTGVSAHPLMRRKIFFAHIDLRRLLDHYKAGKKIYLYTGRGPSNSSLHMGHVIPLSFTAFLQKAFKCHLVGEMSDLEKAMFKQELTLEEANRLSFENAKQMIALGFDKEKTFFFNSSEYISPETFGVISRIWKKSSVHSLKKIYGFEDSANAGMIAWPAFEQAPCFPEFFPHLFKKDEDVMCLVVCSVDQTPFFRGLRDFIESLGGKKPSIICGKFLTGLAGVGNKMSSTATEIPAITLTDSPEEVKSKIVKYAFSASRSTLKEHQEHGLTDEELANDVSFDYLRYFLEDEEELTRIANAYKSGKMSSSEVKASLAKTLSEYLTGLQEIVAKTSDEEVKEWFVIREEK